MASVIQLAHVPTPPDATSYLPSILIFCLYSTRPCSYPNATPLPLAATTDPPDFDAMKVSHSLSWACLATHGVGAVAPTGRAKYATFDDRPSAVAYANQMNAGVMLGVRTDLTTSVSLPQCLIYRIRNSNPPPPPPGGKTTGPKTQL